MTILGKGGYFQWNENDHRYICKLEKEMATHSSTLAWRSPWTGEPGGLQSMGSQRVRHDWATPHYVCCIFAICGIHLFLKTGLFLICLCNIFWCITVCYWPSQWSTSWLMVRRYGSGQFIWVSIQSLWFIFSNFFSALSNMYYFTDIFLPIHFSYRLPRNPRSVTLGVLDIPPMFSTFILYLQTRIF